MQTYILLTKLASQASAQLEDKAKASYEWYNAVKHNCPEVRFLSHYALLGRYDFIDIYEAPNEEVAAKVSLISRMNGALYAESLIAIPHNRYLELSEEVSNQYDDSFKSFLKQKKAK